jgi:hypothetical protein
MKTIIVILLFALTGSLAIAQDTAYISQDKATALFFPSAVKILNGQSIQYTASNKGNGVLTVRALSSEVRACTLNVQDENSKKVYHIPVAYSYGRAGRRIGYGMASPNATTAVRPVRLEQIVAQQLASGKRKDVAAHEKTGGVKAWINKLSLAGNRIFIRLDVRNRSNLPYGIDFVRFYIRDRKTVDRMATHEQEIVPLYSNLHNHTGIVKGQEVAKVFAFKRFSLADDEALFIEVYERSGNRNLYLQIRQSDFDDIKIISIPQHATQMLAANFSN